VNDTGFGYDRDEPVAQALMRANHDLERGRVQERAAPEIDDHQTVGAQIRFGAFHRNFKIFGVGNIELAEDVERYDSVKILANKSRAVV